MRLELVTLVVRDYDEALAYYTGVLGFVLVEDTRLTETKRWIVVRPPGSAIGLLLARADTRTTAGPHRGSDRWTRRLLPVHRRPRSRPRTPARGRRALPRRTARRAIRHGRRVRGLLRKCLGSDRNPFAGGASRKDTARHASNRCASPGHPLGGAGSGHSYDHRMPTDTDAPGYWPSRWPGEDGGPRAPRDPAIGIRARDRRGRTTSTSCRAPAPLATMVVLREPGEVFLLGHTDRHRRDQLGRTDRPGHARGRDAFARSARRQDVAGRHRRARERLPLRRVRAPRAPTHAGFGDRHEPRAAARPPVQQLRDPAGRRDRAEGFRRVRCRVGSRTTTGAASELLVLEPEALEITARLQLPEASIARLSAAGDTIYVVGDEHLFRVAVGRPRRSRSMTRSDLATARLTGQTYGWDAVLTERRRLVPRQRRGERRVRGNVRRPGRLRGAAAPRARRPRVGRGRSHGDLRSPERDRRQPAGHRRIPCDRGRIRQRERCAGGLRLRHRRQHLRRVGHERRTTRATRSCSQTPARS